jgi:DNA-directed RNA polymerase specialized sigma subunit
MASVEFTLNLPRHYDNKIRRLEASIAGLRSCLLPGAIRYDKDKVVSTPVNTMEELYARIDELERKLDKPRNDRAAAALEADEILRKLPDGLERTTLVMFYIERKSMTDIADDLHISLRYSFKVKKRAMEKLNRVANADAQGELLIVADDNL